MRKFPTSNVGTNMCLFWVLCYVVQAYCGVGHCGVGDWDICCNKKMIQIEEDRAKHWNTQTCYFAKLCKTHIFGLGWGVPHSDSPQIPLVHLTPLSFPSSHNCLLTLDQILSCWTTSRTEVIIISSFTSWEIVISLLYSPHNIYFSPNLTKVMFTWLIT